MRREPAPAGYPTEVWLKFCHTSPLFKQELAQQQASRLTCGASRSPPLASGCVRQPEFPRRKPVWRDAGLSQTFA